MAVEQLTGAAPPVRRPRTSEPVPRPHAVSGVRDVETPARVVRAAANTPGESAGAPATAPLGGDGGPGTSPGQRRLGVGAPLQRAWRAVPGVEVPDVADEDLSVPGALLRLLALLAGESERAVGFFLRLGHDSVALNQELLRLFDLLRNGYPHLIDQVQHPVLIHDDAVGEPDRAAFIK